MTQPPDPKYASAGRPVNRRTTPSTPRAPVQQPAPPPRVQQQLHSTQARQLLGAPLAHRLGRPPSARSAKPMGAHHAVLALAPLCMLAGGWIAWPPAATAALAAGGALMIGGAAASLWALRARSRSQPVAETASTFQPFDPQALAQLDAVMDLLAPELPTQTLSRLASIKVALVRMAPVLATAQVSERFTMDDRLYVTECVRRYLPDSLQACLQVPVHLRTAGAPSPLALLDEQLDLLLSELQWREQKLGDAAAEQLRQQRRFLKAKQDGG